MSPWHGAAPALCCCRLQCEWEGDASCLLLSCSESTQYELLYSRGTGVIHVVGIVPQSHLSVLTFSVEDGEITRQVGEPKCWIWWEQMHFQPSGVVGREINYCATENPPFP